MKREDMLHKRRAARWIGLLFIASGFCSIGLTVVYAAGGQPQLEGLLLGAAFAMVAVGFVLWGKRLMPAGPFVEERPPMSASSEEDRDLFAEDFEEDLRGIGRRRFLGRALLWALGALGVAAAFPIRSLGPSPGRSLFRTPWRRGTRLVTELGRPVLVHEVPVGGVLTVFPEGHTESMDAQTILIRVDPASFTPPAARARWSPEGFLAYSKICTHAGCPVGLYEENTRRLFCPCHQSVFDVVNRAEPLAGPAARPLPQLPVEIDGQGYLRAQGDFSEPVGPEWWNFTGGDP